MFDVLSVIAKIAVLSTLYLKLIILDLILVLLPITLSPIKNWLPSFIRSDIIKPHLLDIFFRLNSDLSLLNSNSGISSTVFNL